MPHVTVKMWRGKPEAAKQQLADEITASVTSILGYGDESVSVAIEEIEPDDWKTQVYEPDITNRPAQQIYKPPGYTM